MCTVFSKISDLNNRMHNIYELVPKANIWTLSRIIKLIVSTNK